MSVKLMTEVFERYPGSAAETLLALKLADHANDDGSSVHPGIESLAKKTRQSERTVQRQLRKMEQTGWLIPIERNNGGRNRANRYRINADWIRGDNLTPIEKGDTGDEKGRHSEQERVTNESENGDTGVTRIEPSDNHQGTIKEPSDDSGESSAVGKSSSQHAEYPESFENTWKHYPKRDGGNPKKAAYKAWRARLKAGASEDELHNGALGYADHLRQRGKEGTRYVQQGSTFFGPDEHYREYSPGDNAPPAEPEARKSAQASGFDNKTYTASLPEWAQKIKDEINPEGVL